MDTQDTTKSVAPDQSQDTCRPEDVIPKKEKIIYGAADSPSSPTSSASTPRSQAP